MRASPSLQPLKSALAGDPDMKELVEFFLDDLQERMSRLTAALEHSDAAQIGQIAHQLKGAGGGYGYPDITTSAGQLEAQARAGSTIDVASLHTKVRDLLTVCERAIAGR